MAMRVAIAGGGTGGHVFPALAVAEEFRRIDPSVQLLFFGTERGLEARVGRGGPGKGGDEGMSFYPIRVAPIVGRGITGTLTGLGRIPLALYDSFNGLRRFSPHLVIGVGGYASGPVLVMAVLTGVPTAIQEQNLLPGLTNRVLGRFVTRVFLSFEETRRHFPSAAVFVVGNPVRAVLRKASQERDMRSRDVFTILVIGGSQGAHRLNEAVIGSLRGLEGAKDRIRFVHQTGRADASRVEKAYAAQGFRAAVSSFIEDMSGAYAQANLVVARAGAGTLAELAVMGRASILVPYPSAARAHQEANARWMASRGAAEVLMEEGVSGEVLAGKITGFLSDPRALSVMEARARELARPDAAEKIVEECRRIAHA